MPEIRRSQRIENGSRRVDIHVLKPIVQIGKNGLNDNVMEEIRKHLKKRKTIKVKCLSYFLEELDLEGSNKDKVKHIANKFKTELECDILSVVGFSIVLNKN